MHELDKRIANLRLRLAEIRSRQEQLTAMQRQFRAQLDRVLDFAVYERGDLDSAISMASEVDVRLAETERTMRHLATIRARCQEELDALLLTSSIETAKAELAELETRLRNLEAEIEELQKVPAIEGEGQLPAEGGKETRGAQLQIERDHLEEEIKQLRRTISQASDQAARAVSERRRATSNE